MFIILKAISSLKNRVFNVLSTLKWSFFLKEFGEGSKIYSGVYIDNPRSIILGKNSFIGKNCHFSSEFKDSKLIIGGNVHINNNVYIDYSGNIEIETGVLISSDTHIISHTHGYNPKSLPKKKSLRIEKNSWIGSKVIIGENVEFISENSIIAIGSNLTKNTSVNSIYGGNPAKLIKKIL